MTDEVRPEVEVIPPMTSDDVRLFIQMITGVVLMGATRIEFHAARWRFICTSLFTHRAYQNEQIRFIDGIEDFEHATMHIQFATDTGQVNCIIMLRQDHPATETADETMLLDSQGSSYPVPAEQSAIETPDTKIWTPN